METVTWAEVQAEEDARMLRNLRRHGFTPPERGRIEEIGNALRGKPALTPWEAWALNEINEFTQRDEEQFRAATGPQPR